MRFIMFESPVATIVEAGQRRLGVVLPCAIPTKSPLTGRLIGPSITLLLCSLCALSARADRRLGQSAEVGYRKAWAVIVGVNYQHLQGAARAEVPPLATAENDARAVYDVLVANYGYTPSTTRLLVGSQATREGIRQLFGDGFLGDAEQVTAEDSVLIFFAGHGNRRETSVAREQYVGLLYPCDVQIIPGKGVDSISCLRIDELLGYLRDYCAARHKLVVFDSCHSGEVFNFHAHRSAGVNRGFRADLFRQTAFQAIAAARGSQTAADADETGQHSPVTRALLDALTNGLGTADRKLFTASELFSYIPHRVSQMPGIRQDPRGGWIAGEGDFYFFPKTLQASDIPARELAALKIRAGSTAADSAGDEGRGNDLATNAGSRSLWIAVSACGLFLVGLVGFAGWQIAARKRGRSAASAGKNRLGSPPGETRDISQTVDAPVAAVGPRLCLRLLGTPCVYQAPPDSSVIRVGRQRRKPDEGTEEGNDFVIRSPDSDDQSLKISRQHFEIRREGPAYVIVDRSSAGTVLNGQRLEKNQPHPLRAGDQVTVAKVITLEVLLLSAALHGAAQSQLNVGAHGPVNGPLLLQASVGDMITVEPEDA